MNLILCCVHRNNFFVIQSEAKHLNIRLIDSYKMAISYAKTKTHSSNSALCNG